MAHNAFDGIFGTIFGNGLSIPTADRGSRDSNDGPVEDGGGEDLGAKLSEMKFDYDRLKRRMESLGCSAKLDGVKEAVLALLPALDSLDEGIRLGTDGLAPVREQFLKGLWECNVMQLCIERGDELDPSVHNAVGTVETDEVAEGRIAQVVRNGYVLRPTSSCDSTIRPALVRTAVKPRATPTLKECL